MFFIYYTYNLLIAISLFSNAVLHWPRRENHGYFSGDKTVESEAYTLSAGIPSNGVTILQAIAEIHFRLSKPFLINLRLAPGDVKTRPLGSSLFIGILSSRKHNDKA
jgi:hypothetical protein